jgi:3,4-dihydroxy 2-butanone 4-phosphate synthase / GTP cyclohydrolase II
MRGKVRVDTLLDTIGDAVASIANGGMAVVVDDLDRENEGDLVMAADLATPAAINFMASEARGLICVPMLKDRLLALGIAPMTSANTDPLGTAFHVGVDHRATNTTGISATDRANTVRALADPTSTATDFRQPGHLFPLGYREGGVLQRPGHTEASVDLCRMAGLSEVAVICEIAADDGEMARLPSLLAFGRRHGLPVVTISDLIKTRRRTEKLVERVGRARVPLDQGDFTAVGYRDLVDGREHIAFVLGDVGSQVDVLVRMHSECLTGDVFGSRRCDCGAQLERSLEMIGAEGRGVVVYLRGHEGRGIGLLDKLRAYELQDLGLDTVDANLALGHPPDGRNYGTGAQILSDLGIHHVRLITNNPAKQRGLEADGIVVTERVPLVVPPTLDSAPYLATKSRRMGHLLCATG